MAGLLKKDGLKQGPPSPYLLPPFGFGSDFGVVQGAHCDFNASRASRAFSRFPEETADRRSLQ